MGLFLFRRMVNMYTSWTSTRTGMDWNGGMGSGSHSNERRLKTTKSNDEANV